MREQAVQLFRAAGNMDSILDLEYLERRIRDETAGAAGLDDLKEALDDKSGHHT